MKVSPQIGRMLVAHLLMGFNVHNNLLWLIRDEGKWEDGYLCPTTYSLDCHHHIGCIKVGSCVRHFDVSLIVCGQRQETVSINHNF